MRIINVVEVLNGCITGIDSFPIHEEQLSQDVVEQAENNFVGKLKEHGIDEEDVEPFIEDGVFEDDNGYCVQIVWSYT